MRVWVGVHACVLACVCVAKERKKKSEEERVRERFCLNLCVQLEKGRFIIQHGAQDFWIILFWFCEKQTLRERGCVCVRVHEVCVCVNVVDI